VPLSAQGAPIHYRARTDILYTVSTFNLTYRVRDDLDVNVAIPIVTLDMDLDVSGRLQQRCTARTATAQAEAANLSGMLVRAKYRFFTGAWDGGPAVAAVGGASPPARGRSVARPRHRLRRDICDHPIPGRDTARTQ
jgi:hypothetical protein